jgi:hypothetical protein
MCKATHAAKVKVFIVSRGQYMSSDNSYTIILPSQMPIFKHCPPKAALSSAEAPLEQPLTAVAVFSTAAHNNRKQRKFAFINADIAESASECCATVLRRHCLHHLNPTL